MAKNYRLLICGVGIEDQKIIEQLVSSDVVIARGEAAAAWLNRLKISTPRVFQKSANQSLDQWCEEALSGLEKGDAVVYVTPITPILTDQMACTLLKSVGTDHTQIINGVDQTIQLLQLDAFQHLTPLITLDGLVLENRHYPPFSADHAVLIHTPEDADQRPQIQSLLGRVFAAHHELFALVHTQDGRQNWQSVKLNELTELTEPIVSLFIPPASTDSSLKAFRRSSPICGHRRMAAPGIKSKPILPCAPICLRRPTKPWIHWIKMI